MEVGDRLMCIWQLASLREQKESMSNSPKGQTVKEITLWLSQLNSIKALPLHEYDSIVSSINGSSNFKLFTMLMRGNLMRRDVDPRTCEGQIERLCWENCKAKYLNYGLEETNLFEIWRLFNLGCVIGSYPPVVKEEFIDWVVTRAFVSIRQIKPNRKYGNMEFQEFLATMVMDMGVEFENALRSEQLELSFNGNTDAFDVWHGEIKNILEQLIGGPSKLERIEAAPEVVVNEVVSEVKSKPVSKSPDVNNNTVKTNNNVKSKGATDSDKKKAEKKPAQKTANPVPIMKVYDAELGIEVERENPSVGVDNKIVEKIKAIFYKIDTSGNGILEENEFIAFMKDMGLAMDDEEILKIYHLIDLNENGTLSFDEFLDYFMKFVLNDSSEKEAEINLRNAFLNADKDGTGSVDFEEFAMFAQNQKWELSQEKLLAAFSKLDRNQDGNISFGTFKDFARDQGAANKLEGAGNREPALEKAMGSVFENTDMDEMAEFLNERWNKFADFKRKGASGEVVMTGGEEMVSDIVPGSYSLVDLACFSDLDPIEPDHLEIQAKWIPADDGSAHGKLVLPEDFDGYIPTALATNEHLRYYGCSFAEGNSLKVDVMFRHGVQDFTYANNYLEDYVTNENAMAGAGIERHDFAHLDCPIESNNGKFVLGKFVDEDAGILHLTAFDVPKRHTLYIPGGTIHSNDYLKGSWRTMLSDETAIDHVQLEKNEKGSKKKMLFNFEKPSVRTN